MKSLYSVINEAKKIGKIPVFKTWNDVVEFFDNIVGINIFGNCWLYSPVNGRHVYIMFMYEPEQHAKQHAKIGIFDAIYINISKDNKPPVRLFFNHSRYNLDDNSNWIIFDKNGNIKSGMGIDVDTIKDNFEEFIGKPLKFWSGNESNVLASINDIVKDLQDMGANWTKARV